jgi:beta-lactamase regulating signal transducer with metallopeptidase domain
MDVLTSLWSAAIADSSLATLLAKATLILVAALGVTILLHRASAGARHTVWLATLASLLLVPAVAAWSPVRVALLPSGMGNLAEGGRHQGGAAGTDATAGSGDAGSSGAAGARTVDHDNAVAGAAAASVAPAPGDARDGAPAGALAGRSTSVASRLIASVSAAGGLSLLAILWAVISLLILASLLRSALTVRRIVRGGTVLDSSDWMHPVYEVSDRLGLAEPPRIVRSPAAKMPFACGLLQPTIVLPEECEGWSRERRSAVLLHEIAHVRRRDLVGHTIGRVACAIYWFHPLVWTGAKRLRAESERACDDIALACGARPSDYAEHLLDIVTSIRGDSTPAVAMAMARRKEFEGRMLAILDPSLDRSAPSRGRSVALAAGFAMFALLVGAVAPVPRAALAADSAQAAGSATMDAPATEAPTAHAAGIGRRAGETHGDTGRVARRGAVDEQVQASTFIGDDIIDTATIASSAAHAAAAATASIGPTIEAAMRDVVSPVVNSVVQEVVPQTLDAVMRGLFGGGSPARAADDRPEVLARILRSDTSTNIRRIAAWGLHEHSRSRIASDALIEAVRRDPSASVREMAAWSLGEGDRKGESIEGALRGALTGDRDPAVRAAAAWSLGSLESRGSVDALNTAMSDTSVRVRRLATWAIGNIEVKEAPPALVQRLRDPDSRTRQLAAWALYQTKDPRTIDPLRAALRTEADGELRYAYVRALTSMGEASVSAIEELLDSSDPRIRQLAVRGLSRSGPDIWVWPWPWPRPSP